MVGFRVEGFFPSFVSWNSLLLSKGNLMNRDQLFALANSDGRTHLGDLSDGTPVFSKKGADHLANHGDVASFLNEGFARLSMSDFNGQNMVKDLDLGRVVGISTCVETTDMDEVVYARRMGRKFGCTRFVKGRKGVDCRSIVVILYLNDEGLVALMTAYVGKLAPAEPSTNSARTSVEKWQECCEFWRSHALCWDGEVEDEVFTSEDFFGTAPA